MKARIVILLMLITASFTEELRAQFNLRPSVQNQSTATIDTVKVKGSDDVVTPVDLRAYGIAYKEYVQRELFKYRNKITFEGTLGINQTSLSNWAAGGDNSFTGRLWTKFVHVYTNEERNFSVESKFEGAYQMVVTEEVARKSEDFFTLTSTPSWVLTDNFSFAGSLDLRSQFTNSYAAPGDTILTSSFFAPATLNLSMGVTYTPIKGFPLSLYLAPISGQGTFVLNKKLSDLGAFGVEPGKMSKTNFGATSKLNYSQKFFADDLSLNVLVQSFWDYSSCPTLLWESNFIYRLSSLFSLNLYFKVLYDESVNTPQVEENNYWQVNQSFGFNVAVNFASKPYGDKPSFLEETYIVGR